MGATARSILQVGLESGYTLGSSTLPTAVAAKRIYPIDSGAKFEKMLTWDKPDERRYSYEKFFGNIVQLTSEVDWSFKSRFYPDAMLGLLAMAITNNPTVVTTPLSAPNPALNTWTFTPANTTVADTTNNIATATMELYDGTNGWQHPNCFLDKLEFSFDATKEVAVMASGKAYDQVNKGAFSTLTQTLLQPAEQPLVGAGASVYIDAYGTSPGVTQNVDVLNGKISINTGWKSLWTATNTTKFNRLYRGKRDVQIDLELDFPNTTEYQNFLANNYRYLAITMNGSLLSAGATKYYFLTFNVPVRYESWVIDMASDHVIAKVKAQNYYDANLGYAFNAVAQVSSASSAYNLY